MKKILSILLVFVLLLSFAVFAMGSSDEEPAQPDNSTKTEQNDTVTTDPAPDNTLGDYEVTIDSCRLAKDYEDNPVVIVKYTFANIKDDDNASFMWAIDSHVFQNGVGLNTAIVIDDTFNYNSDDQMKEIKKGASIELEVAYVLNDTTTPIEVELGELISFSDKKITKTFDLPQQ